MQPTADANSLRRSTTIACLGWGSLIWKPGDLPIRPPWNDDGPWLPVEFARQSLNTAVSLVLVPDARPVQALWVVLDVASVDEARHELSKREGTPQTRSIGYWSALSRTDDQFSSLIGAWAARRNLDGVVWTALKPKWDKQIGVVPTIEQLLERLRTLSGEPKVAAERYIRLTPPQIRTAYRERIEAELGWTPSETFPLLP